MSSDGLLSRWARRKAEVKAGVSVDAVAPHPDPLPGEERGEEESSLSPSGRGTEGEGEVVRVESQEPAPTMADVAELTPSSDYTRFLAPQVDETVKRAAMKKLFTDPHFNVMDGLDTYIDDYGKSEPIPETMLRRMSQSHALGLFSEEPESAQPKASPDGDGAASVPQSGPDPTAVPPDEDPDLRLQQDDAAGCGGTGKGPPA